MNNNATNHTQYFNFPLFTGTDKPSVLTDWNGTMEELDSTLEDYRVRISGCEQTTQSFMDRLVVLKNQFDELVARVQGDENIIQDQGLEIDGLQNALIETNESIKRILTDMGTFRTDIETMETLVNNCVTTVGTLTSQVNTLASNVEALKADFQSMDATIGHMDESISTMNGKVNGLNTRVTTVEGKMDSAEDDISVLQSSDTKNKAMQKFSILYSPSTYNVGSKNSQEYKPERGDFVVHVDPTGSYLKYESFVSGGTLSTGVSGIDGDVKGLNVILHLTPNEITRAISVNDTVEVHSRMRYKDINGNYINDSAGALLTCNFLAKVFSVDTSLVQVGIQDFFEFGRTIPFLPQCSSFDTNGFNFSAPNAAYKYEIISKMTYNGEDLLSYAHDGITEYGSLDKRIDYYPSVFF